MLASLYVCFTMGDQLDEPFGSSGSRHLQCPILFFTLFSWQITYDDDDDVTVS